LDEFHGFDNYLDDLDEDRLSFNPGSTHENMKKEEEHKLLNDFFQTDLGETN
jgi:hypothetical protein